VNRTATDTLDKMKQTRQSKPLNLHQGRFEDVKLTLPEYGLDEYAKIFAANEAPRDLATLKWRYADNPSREASCVYLGLDVQDGANEAAAIYAISGAPFRAGGQLCLGSQSLDTLTDKNYRRKGLFNWLGEATYADAARSGVKLIYGFPNAFSGPGFVKQLSWKILGPAPFLMRPLRTGYLVRQVLGKLGGASSWVRMLDFKLPTGLLIPRQHNGIELRELSCFTEEYDALCAQFSAEIGVCVERSSRYMNWRICEKPGAMYTILGGYKDGKLLGVSVWLVRERHGAHLGYLIDLICHPDESVLQAVVLRETLSRMSADGAEAVLAWQLPHSPAYNRLRRAGFFPLPTAVRPLKLDWGVRAFDERVADTLHDARNWYISYIDSDTV
jgi:GNAT superfamily N-acetyltransferase